MAGFSLGASQAARIVPGVGLTRVILPMSRESRGTGASSTAVAFGAGAAGASATVTATASEAVALWVSVAAKVKVMVVLAETSGATKVVDIEVALARVMSRAESCDHR